MLQEIAIKRRASNRRQQNEIKAFTGKSSVYDMRMKRLDNASIGVQEEELERLRQLIYDNLQAQGFVIEGGELRPPSYDKDTLRKLNEKAVRLKREKLTEKLKDKEPYLLDYIANGDEVEPSKMEPMLIPVYPNTEESLLFKYITLFWSIPVSEGVGRRVKFLVKDKYNGKVVGIIGLTDPVLHQRTRDTWVGWTRDDRCERLRYVLDGHILGAVPPYNRLICGKLIAMIATSKEVRDEFCKRYTGKTTVTLKRTDPTQVALITTLSALGRSAIYNRLKYKDRLVFQSIGYSEGFGSFHFDPIYNEILDFVKTVQKRKYPNKNFDSIMLSRMEIVTIALHYLGLPQSFVRHNIHREVFVAPLARNTREFLRGETDELDFYEDTSMQEYFDYFRERWLLPRAQRDTSYKDFRKESVRIWTE